MDLINPNNGDAAVPNVVNQTEPPIEGRINWSNYNFPPCLHIVHFSLTELQGKLRSFVASIYLSYLILLAILFINRIL